MTEKVHIKMCNFFIQQGLYNCTTLQNRNHNFHLDNFYVNFIDISNFKNFVNFTGRQSRCSSLR